MNYQNLRAGYIGLPYPPGSLKMKIMDYKELLIVYMNHIIHCESISFLDHMWFEGSDEQKKELEKIEQEIWEQKGY